MRKESVRLSLVSLVLFLCVWAGVSVSASLIVDISGTWKVTNGGVGEICVLRQEGNRVYGHNTGRTRTEEVFEHKSSGTFDGKNLVLHYKFIKKPQGYLDGTWYLTLSADGKTLEGRWVADSKSGPVKLTKKEEIPTALVNGGFSQGLEGWTISESGYYHVHPYSFGTHPPTTVKGYLDLGVYGGYYRASQEVKVPSADLLFSFKMKAESWATYYSLASDCWPPNEIGTDEMGKVSVQLGLYDAENNPIGSIEYYYSPHLTYESTETGYYEKLGSGSPPPTGWKTVQVDVRKVIRDHLKIDASKVVKVRVTAYIFGTHEDRTYTVGYFDDFSLTSR